MSIRLISTMALLSALMGANCLFENADRDNSNDPKSSSYTETTDTTKATHILMYSTAALNGARGGRSGLDSTCTTAKPSGATCTNIRAFVSVGAGDQISLMPSNYAVPTDLEIRSSSDVVIRSNWSDLISFGPASALSSAGVASGFWWTGASSNGGTNTDCTAWTVGTGAASGTNGDTASLSTTWLENSTFQYCNNTHPFICICY